MDHPLASEKCEFWAPGYWCNHDSIGLNGKCPGIESCAISLAGRGLDEDDQ